MAEQTFHKRRVAGSIPAAATIAVTFKRNALFVIVSGGGILIARSPFIIIKTP